jgi:23S rRNA (pseudouridine1915-N3)-methyltransferase
MLKVISVGKAHESWVAEGILRYEKRLKAPFNIEWVLLPSSSKEGLEARQNESEAILKRLESTDFVVLLDEKGEKLNSPALSSLIQHQVLHSKKIIIIIGGAYGVDDLLHQRANKILSISDMVFPHQLVRLILIEQLYRAQEISLGKPYHHA